MPLQYIKIALRKKEQRQVFNLNKVINWITSGQELGVVGPFFNSEEEVKNFLQEEVLDDLIKTIYDRVFLVAEKAPSGYILGLGFAVFFPSGTQYFQYEKPVRFEDDAEYGFACIDTIKSGEKANGIYVTKIDTEATAKDYQEQFYSVHREFLQKDKDSYWGIRGFFGLYRTLIKPQMSLAEIVHHAEKEPANRSRTVLVYMGLMNRNGTKTATLERLMPDNNLEQESKNATL